MTIANGITVILIIDYKILGWQVIFDSMILLFFNEHHRLIHFKTLELSLSSLVFKCENGSKINVNNISWFQ